MTTRAPAAERPSRLDPEQMPRRDFLGQAAVVAASTALLLALGGAARLPRAAVLPSASKKFRASLPDGLLPGVVYVPPARNVALHRDDEGVWGISLVCTHLGCIVKPSATGFDCPCHGSRFDHQGGVTRGPAPKALDWVAVRPLDESTVMVDEGTPVKAGTKESA